MNWLDIVLIVIIVLATIMGVRTGLLGAAFSVVAFLVGWVLASQFSDDLGGFFEASISNDTIVTVISYILIIVLTLAASRIVWGIARPTLSIATLGLSSLVDRLGGVLLGLLVGFALTGALIVVLARVTYDFSIPDLPVAGAVTERIPDPEETRKILERALSGSQIVAIFIDVTDAVPGGALGFVPWDFQASLDILEQNTF